MKYSHLSNFEKIVFHRYRVMRVANEKISLLKILSLLRLSKKCFNSL